MVGAGRASAQDQVAVGVACGLDDGTSTEAVDSEEDMLCRSGFHAIDGGLHVPVGAVLEPDGHRQPRCELTVDLRLGGSGADRTPGDGVGDVVRTGGLEELAADRQAERSDVEQQRSRDAQSTLDVVAAVHGGVVDETLPADGGAGLLEVDPHDDLEPVGVGVGQRGQTSREVQGRHRIVDRAGADDHQESVVAAGEDVGDLVAMALNVLGGRVGQRQFGADLLGSRNGAKGHDPPIRGAFGVECGAGDGHDGVGLPVSGSQGVPADCPVP